MLHKRRIEPNLIARALSFSHLAESKVCKDHKLKLTDLIIIVCAHTLQFETNKLLTPGALRARSGLGASTVNKALPLLCNRGFLSLVSHGRYNVSVSGGYVVRSLVTEITRCLNSSVFSLWTNQATKDPELAEYFEPSVIERHKRKKG